MESQKIKNNSSNKSLNEETKLLKQLSIKDKTPPIENDNLKETIINIAKINIKNMKSSDNIEQINLKENFDFDKEHQHLNNSFNNEKITGTLANLDNIDLEEQNSENLLLEKTPIGIEEYRQTIMRMLDDSGRNIRKI